MDAGAYIALRTAAIYDLPSFHAESRRALGFPDGYAGTLESWIGCMATLRDPDGIVGIRVEPGEMLQLEIADFDELRERAPDVVDAIVIGVSAANRRYLDLGQAPAIALILS